MSFERIPAELRERPAWVGYRWEGDKKPPYRVDGMGHASSTKPETWGTFEQAVAMVDAGLADGIGFALASPYVGVDLDKELPEADRYAIARALNSYTEESVSGTGLHVVLKANLNGGRHPEGFGVFQEGRFFYCSGKHVPGTPWEIAERQDELDAVLAEYLQESLSRDNDSFEATPVDLDDQELLEAAFSVVGAKYRPLWQGSWEGSYSSQSEADLALCSFLAWVTGRHAGRIDRMFRSSGLYRDKWEREDYREQTIKTAIAATGESSQPQENYIAPPSVLEALQEKRNQSGLPFASLSEALSGVDDEPEWVWRDFIARGATTLYAGRVKVGKSTLLFGLFGALERGESFLGLETVSTGALLLSEEPAAALRKKATRFGLEIAFNSPQSLGPRNKKSGGVHLLRRTQTGGVAWSEVVRQAVAYCIANDLGVLVIDTFDKWVGIRGDDENKTGAILAALEPLQKALAANVAVLIITHHRKSGGQYGEGIRGASALVGACDIVLEIERDSNDETHRRRILRGISRFEEPPELVVELVEGGYQALGDIEQVRTEAQRNELREALEGFAEPPTAAEVADVLGIAEATARGRLKAAARRGDLEQSGTGKKGDPHRWGPGRGRYQQELDRLDDAFAQAREDLEERGI